MAKKEFKLTEKNCRVYRDGGYPGGYNGGIVGISYVVYVTKKTDGLYPVFNVFQNGGTVLGEVENGYTELPDGRGVKVGKKIYRIGERVEFSELPRAAVEIIEDRFTY